MHHLSLSGAGSLVDGILWPIRTVHATLSLLALVNLNPCGMNWGPSLQGWRMVFDRRARPDKDIWMDGGVRREDGIIVGDRVPNDSASF